MKKSIILLMFLILFITGCSCKESDKELYYHINSDSYVLVDENSLFNDNYYAKSKTENTKEDKSFYLYSKKDNLKVDEININEKRHLVFAIYDDYLYYVFYTDDKVYYSYKKIGDNIDIYHNVQSILEKDFNGFLTINDKLFYFDKMYHLQLVDNNLELVLPCWNTANFYYASNKSQSLVSIRIEEEKIIVESQDKTQKYYYDIPNTVKEAKYTENTNGYYWNWPVWNKPTHYYDIMKYAVLLEDDCLYFSYGKYLGEFDNARHNCGFHNTCIFSNRQSEILRFNSKIQKIESVAILPEGYSVLKIYNGGAIVMKNSTIAQYDFNTGALNNQIEIDWKDYYQLDGFEHLKIYLDNNQITKIDTCYYRLALFSNFEYIE